MVSRGKFTDWPSDAVDLPADKIAMLYASGFRGAVHDPESVARLTDQMHWKSFADAAHEFGTADSGEGKLSLPFRSVIGFSPDAYITAQRRGDCVSFGTRNACDLARAVEIHIKREPEGWHNITATEPIYWYRGHNGEGANCGRLAEWVWKAGGMLLRKNYAELGLDLTTYDSSKGRNGSSGPPANVRAEAAKHRIGTVTNVRTVEEARDALANGYGVNVCSGHGFSSTRGEDGISRRSGSWAHSMAWVAVDARPETIRKHGGMLFLVQNSWGYRWISGPKAHGQPDGSFWIVQADAAAMLRGGGGYAFSNTNGFPAVDLPNYGTADVLG